MKIYMKQNDVYVIPGKHNSSLVSRRELQGGLIIRVINERANQGTEFYFAALVNSSSRTQVLWDILPFMYGQKQTDTKSNKLT